MDTKDIILFGVGAALGWYIIRHKMRTGANI